MLRKIRACLATKTALVLLSLLNIGVGVGIANSPLMTTAKDGLSVKGRLTTRAFHAEVAGACDTDLAKAIASADWDKVQASVFARVKSVLTPHSAWANDNAACKQFAFRIHKNLIVNSGETALRDCFNNNSGTECDDVIKTLKFHGIGTGSTAAAEGNTGCETELTTQYNPDNTRATGSQTTNGSNVYRTVGTNTVDATAAVTEWCLQNQAATGGGTMWSRVVFSVINLASSDSLQTTYDLTIE